MRAYPWRQFGILVVAGVLGTLAVIPYALALSPALTGAGAPPLSRLIASALVNGAVEMIVAVGLGLLAARAVGLRAPVSEALATRGNVGAAIRGLDAGRAALLGIGSSLVVVALDLTAFHAAAVTLVPASGGKPGPVAGFFAAFEGGITEEILLRLFVMSAITWLLGRRWRGLPPGVFWAANIGAAVLFGLGHLPSTAALAPLTPLLVGRAVVLNGIIGVVAGWLYWRRGLESAMLAHFAADLVLHVAVAI